jgi:hypothetical protein
MVLLEFGRPRRMTLSSGTTLHIERPARVRGLLELLFSANIACTLAYALAIYAFGGSDGWSIHSDAEYYFFRGVVRVADLLHLGALNPVSTDAVARRALPIQWNTFAISTTFLASVCGVAVSVLLVVRALNRTSLYRAIFRPLAGITAIFSPPVLCLLTLRLAFEAYSVDLFFKKFFLAFFLGELVGFVLLAFVAQRRPVSVWTSALLLFVHFGFWCWVPAATILRTEPRGNAALAVYLFHVLIWLVPCVIAWLVYVRPGARGKLAFDTGSGAGKWTAVAGCLGLATLFGIWFPAWGYSLAPPKDLKAAVIEMSRGPCFGSCPAYKITIHGDGTVEYAGGRLARQDRQTGNIGSEDFSRILQQLDAVHFSTLEDRAFLWCFDSSSVSIAVSVDGRSKRVVSDAGCTGAKSGLQARFVEVGNNIDKVVGSERWIRCEGGRCRE